MTKKIILPSRITTVSSVLGLGLSSISLSENEDCEIYFSDCQFGEPLPMLILGREIRSLVRNNRGSKITAYSRPNAFRGYADHVGFFRYCGFQRGNEPGEAFGSPNYIPITVLDLDDLKQASGDRPYAEIMIEKAYELTQVLMQQDSGQVFEIISYSIREMLRNAAEHSRSSVVVVFGQYWPARHRAEIALFDAGIGINASLSEAEIVDGTSDREALLKAVQPGITSVSEAERAYQDETFRNSGFGLYVTSKFFSEVGHFRLISGNEGLTLSATGALHHPWKFDGTCIQMSCDLRRMVGSIDRIAEIIKEGEAATNGTALASSASKKITL